MDSIRRQVIWGAGFIDIPLTATRSLDLYRRAFPLPPLQLSLTGKAVLSMSTGEDVGYAYGISHDGNVVPLR